MITILQFLTIIIKSVKHSFGFLFLILSNYLIAQTVDFTFDIKSKCAPTVVFFQNISDLNSGYKYMWDFDKGGVIFSNEEFLQEAYATSGTYIVTLSLIDGTDTLRKSKTIQIANPPSAKFNASIVSGCIPLVVNFTDNSVAGDATIKEMFWDFRNGDTRFGANINYTYIAPGKFDVFYKITDNNECTSYIESKELIQVFPKPFVNFRASENFACTPPLLVSFFNNSTGTGQLNCTWNFGNGQTSNNFTASTIYENGGSYNVSLKVRDANNCSDSLTKYAYVNIGSPPGLIYAESNFQRKTATNSLLCPDSIIFGTTALPKSDYTWKITYKNVTHTFIGDSVIKFFAPDSGKISVKLIYNLTAECPDSINNSFIIEYIVADFQMDKQYVCQLPADVMLKNNASEGSEIRWILPENQTSTNDTISYHVPGTLSYAEFYSHQINNISIPFTLIATSPGGCNDTITKNLAGKLPVARFMPDISAGCIPLDVNFYDSSRSAEVITNWTYIIDGIKFSTNVNGNLDYSFNTTGNHAVQLVIKNDSGCVDTSYTVTIHTGRKLAPEFSISPSEICYGDKLWFNGNSDAMDSIDSWNYFSEDIFTTGSISTPDTFIVVRSPLTGLHSIGLVVDFNGCPSDTIRENLYTLNGPVGSFRENLDCSNPLYYQFISEMESANSLIWRINGTAVSNLDSFDYTFATKGNYEVRLEAYGPTGCVLSKTKIIKVRQVKAEFSFENKVICFDNEAEFDASASIDYIDSCFNEGFLWDFDDGTPRRRNWFPVQKHQFADTGKFIVTLVVKAENNCVDTIIDSIQVVQPPVSFQAIPASGCGPIMHVDFNFDTIHPSIQSWTWIFGDNTIDDTQAAIVSHDYSNSYTSSYYAGLIVTDIYGCTNVNFQQINMYVPSAEFQAYDNSLCLGETAFFIFTDTLYTDYTFDFGDGTSSSNLKSHKYNLQGIYDVSLTILDNGCTATKTLYNYMSIDKANAEYTVSDNMLDCYPATVSFDYSGNSGTVVSGLWTFAPGVTSNSFNSHYEYTYTEPGTYLTSFVVTTINGCRAASDKTITVSGPIANLEFFPQNICSGDEVNFQLNNPQNIDEFRWIFGDGEISTETNPRHIYYAKGDIFPALYLRNGTCEVTLTDEVLHVSTLEANFEITDNATDFCEAEIITATNTSTTFVSSVWMLDNNFVSNSTNYVSDPLSGNGDKILSLVVTDAANCSDTMKKTIHVFENPVFTISGDSALCPGASGFLIVNPQNGWQISWSPSNAVNDPSSFTTVINPTITTNYSAVVTNANGCSYIQYATVRVKDQSNITRKPANDTTIFIGESVELFINSAGEDDSYRWTPDYKISCRSCNNPIVSPEKNQVYTVTVKDDCIEQNYDFIVNVFVDYYLQLPDAFTPNDDGNNDVFQPESKGVVDFELKIFNRWGNLIFTSTDINQGWNGAINGKIQNADTYTYYIKAVSEHGYAFEKKGSFMLIR